ncbi:MAG: hypothetical protein VW802_14770 [Rhodospirillaceae bacterium]|jgi:tetratricopeptide (TPR) repeat protein
MVEQNSSLPERSDPRPWPDAIRAQLNRLFVQPHFVGADDQVSLLRHLIELTEQGKIETVQTSDIAQHLFRTGRNEAEAESHLVKTYQELREALMAYFNARGRNDPVIFDLPEKPVGLSIRASDLQLEIAEIEADSEQSAVLPQNKPVNIHAIVAMGIMVVAGAIYFFGIDRLTTGPTGPELITDVGPLNQPLSSVAVQPFRSLEPENTNVDYAKSLSIELTARLGREYPLRIIAPATMLNLPPDMESLSDIANKVDVRYVLSGTLATAEKQHLLTVKLTHAGDNKTIWQESFRHNPENISSLYGKISKAITAKLASVGPSPTKRSKRERAEDKIVVQQAGYTSYLAARRLLITETPESLAHAITLFQSAINETPGLPRAQSGLAASLTRLAGYGMERIAPQQSMVSAHKASINALRLNEYYPEPYVYLGKFRTTMEWDWKEAERVFVYAIQFNPSFADARLYYSRFLEAFGRHRDAIDQAERAHILNPLSAMAYANRAWQYLQAEWFTRARKHFKKIRKTHPKHWSGPWGLGHYYWRRDDPDEAINMFKAAVKIDPENTFILASLGHVYGLTGKAGPAQKILATMLDISRSRYVSPIHIAMIYAGLGNRNAAFDWLEKALTQRAHGVAWINVTKEFHPLHDDPRFQTLLKRLKLTRPIGQRRP